MHRFTGRVIVLIAFYLPHWWRRYFHSRIIGIAERMTPNTGQIRSTGVISHLYSQPGAHVSHRYCTREHSEQLGAVGGRLCVSRRWGTPRVPTRQYHWLVRIIPWLSGKWNPLLRDKQNYVQPLDKLAREPYLWEQNKEENVAVRSLETLLILPDVKAAHDFESLNLIWQEKNVKSIKFWIFPMFYKNGLKSCVRT